MKRFISFFAAALMISAVSCTKENGKGNGGGNDDEDDGGSDFVSAIAIDGSFSDWDAVKTFDATCPPEATKLGIQKMRVYGDEMYICMYFEFRLEDFTYDGKNGTDKYAPLTLYIDADNDYTTGASTDWMFAPSGFEYCIQGAVGSEDAIVSFDPNLQQYKGDDGLGWWDGDDATRVSVMAEGSGFGAGAGVIEGNIVKYEFSLLRALFPELGNEIKVGAYLSSVKGDEWPEVGWLPIGVPTEADQNGLAGMLDVTLPEAQ